jgi:hypothetical protein
MLEWASVASPSRIDRSIRELAALVLNFARFDRLIAAAGGMILQDAALDTGSAAFTACT